MKDDESLWMKQAGGLQNLLTQSFHDAAKRIVEMQGTRTASWSCGKYHRIGPTHPIGQAGKPLGWLLNARTYPVGGSNITVGAMSYSPATGMVTSFAPWRQVVDLADPAGNSRDVVMPGQSGHFLSPHYTDQQVIHNNGELHPQLFTPAAYQVGAKLVLEP